MTEFRIRRCHIKVVRKGGAAWMTSADRKQLARLVQRLVLAALEEWLQKFWPGATRPLALGSIDVRLQVPMQALDGPAPLVSPRLRDRLAEGFGDAARVARAAEAIGLAKPDPPTPPEKIAAARDVLPDLPPGPLLTVLSAWAEDGGLQQRLQIFDPVVLRAWWLTLAAEIARLPQAPGAGAPSAPDSSLTTIAEQSRAACARIVSSERAVLIARLLALARLLVPRAPIAVLRLAAKDLPSLLPDAPDVASAAVAPGAPRGREPEDADARAADASAAGEATQVAAVAPVSSELPSPVRRRPAGESHVHQVETVLPFLLLGPLSRIGWLEAAAAMCAAVGRNLDIRLLAYALALKALPAPERGWRHQPAMLRAAALFAGLAEPPPGSALAAFAEAADAHPSVLDATAARALLAGHAAGRPYGVVETALGLALFEPEGLFPVLIRDDWASLAAGLSLEQAIVAAGADLPAATLRALNDCGQTFVVDGAPARAEIWRALRGPGRWQGMTNCQKNVSPKLAKAGVAWSARRLRAAEIIAELGERRPLAAQDCGIALERTLTCAATLALGQIAWTLFQADPAAWTEPDALLAFERFTSLSARVNVGPDRIDVTLPLGARYVDLRRHGLVDTVRAVPWLGGRPVVFGGG